MVALLETGYQGVRPGQLVVHSMDAFAGAVGVSDSQGKCSPEYIVCDMREGLANAAYYARLLRLMAQQDYIQAVCSAVRERAPRIRFATLGGMPLPHPPLEEQNAIVRFLEEKECDIEQYLATKRRMIEQLNAHETSLASKHFDDLRRQFGTVRIKDVCEIVSGYSFESSGFVSDGDGVRLVRGANVGIGHLRWTAENTVRWPAIGVSEVRRWLLREGDLVLGLNRPWIDGGLRLAEVLPEDLPCLVLQRVARLRAHDRLLNKFLSIMLRSPRLLWELEPDFTGVGTPYIDEHHMKCFHIPLPPLKKQQEVVALHAQQTQDIRNAIRLAECEIAVMEEYRTRLIADAVMGQIDVRRPG